MIYRCWVQADGDGHDTTTSYRSNNLRQMTAQAESGLESGLPVHTIELPHIGRELITEPEDHGSNAQPVTSTRGNDDNEEQPVEHWRQLAPLWSSGMLVISTVVCLYFTAFR